MTAIRTRWHHSILARAGLILLGVLLLFGAVTVAINLHYNRARAEQATELRLSQLLDTVESTASIACFTRDDVLAGELIAGLLRNSEVLSVVVEADGVPLADSSRQATDAAAAVTPDSRVLVRDIYSPFSPQTPVGRVLLTPNQALIDQELRQETRILMLQMAMQLLLVALAFAAATLLLIIRPIKAISDRLHGMDATRGERLQVPAGHRGSEIGLLVADVNRLADRLVRTLEDERALRIQREIDEQRYHAIFENADTGLFQIDHQGLLSSWNPAFARLMGLSSETRPERELALLDLDWHDPQPLAELLSDCRNTGGNPRRDSGAQDTPRTQSAELRHTHPDGVERWLSVVLTPITDRSVQGVLHDVTHHLEAEQSARRLAVTDRITGMANQLGLEQRLRALIQASDPEAEPPRPERAIALVLISLDNFKRLSSGLDPAIGDALLTETARRLSSGIEGANLIARVGENQFALLMADPAPALEIERMLEQVFADAQQPVFIAGAPLTLTLSGGIAFHTGTVANPVATLFQHADLALASAQAGPGGPICFFDPDLARLAQERHQLETDLRHAIRDGQFVPFFQPLVDLQRGALVGAEVLIRWQHPQRGLVPPNAFIPLAEETGLINDMGRWILESAGRQLAAWQHAGRDLYLSVNVSAHQIPKGLTPDALHELAQRLGFAPASLALEITESILISDVDGAQAWLDAVRARGFRVFLDDFGTGYSSLSYLKRFTVDRLKIDQGFIRDLATNAGDRALVEAVTAIADSFGMQVVAEGVEDAEHVRRLRAMGCHYGQGYFFSPPVPLDAFSEVGRRIPELMQPFLDAAPGSNPEPAS
ncbi:EAL domain-containing protein [Thiohalocapsa marina]|uniref:cyclic-guanylate-specific phosphodiesterase n=1 Tax=Thiohalocapsa marina TaxID=424902 RepID=A0A5M8FM40_9GAMM|nr:EAL domain-containing protein [Thiohalocapsa marina]KAA6185839.1 EAL domain-containing protein [Thiohalocapsa marina]